MGEFDTVKSVLDGASAAYGRMEKELVATKAELAAAQQELRQQADQGQHKQHADRARADLDRARGEHNRQRLIDQAQIDKLAQENARLKAKYEGENTRLKSELKTVKVQAATAASAEATQQALADERAARRRDNETEHAIQVKLRGELGNVRAQLEKEQALRRATEQKLTLTAAREKAAKAVDHPQRTQLLESKADDLRKQLDAAIVDRNKVVADTNAHISALNEAARQQHNLLDRAKNDLMAARAEISTRSGELVAANNRVLDLTRELAEVKADLSAQLQVARREIIGVKADCDEKLKAEGFRSAELSSQGERKDKEIAKLSRELSEAIKELDGGDR